MIFKSNYVLLLLFMFLSQTIFSQKRVDTADLKVQYRMLIFSDQDSLMTGIDYDVFEYSLLFNSQKSIYSDDTLKKFYNYIRNNRGNYGLPSVSKGYPKSKSSIYKDGDKIIATLPIGKNLYSFQVPNLQWELLPEQSKEILGYSCNLAKTITDTGKLYYAWYTTKIPIPEGPFRFKGLNGLVLEVYSEDKSLIIKSSEIIKSNEPIEPIDYITVYNVSDKANFLKKRREFIENPNSDEFSSRFKVYSPDGKELKTNKRVPLKINESILLD